MNFTKLFETLLMVLLLVTMHVGLSAASFSSCFERCRGICRNKLNLPSLVCNIRCTLDCVIPPPPPALDALKRADLRHLTAENEEGLDFCKIGCVSVKCRNIIEDENPSKEKVQGCAVSCIGACNKNYLV